MRGRTRQRDDHRIVVRSKPRSAADVRDGYVTIEGARRDYGVLVDPATFDVVGLER